MSEIEQTTADDRTSGPEFRLIKTVVMVGMMGAGKTGVGRAVAAKLQAPFLDSDAEIEAAANLSVPEIFDRDGEVFFRKRETEVIARLLDGQGGILSTGGGAFLAQANRDMISRRGVSLWLNADLELLWSRVKHKDTRPLLRTPNPKATLGEIYEVRVPLYAQADLSVRCEAALSIDEMADRVIETLAGRKDVLERIDA
ncbi:MAG: shikimate kinase [Sulfitobacter sp.]